MIGVDCNASHWILTPASIYTACAMFPKGNPMQTGVATICTCTTFALVAMLAGCGDFGKSSSKKDTQCTARYAPVGNNPEIALDTQSGQLCRTVADTNDPLGILDPACGVSEEMKKVGFVPRGCKSSGQTWVKGQGDKQPSPYTSLPRCSEK